MEDKLRRTFTMEDGRTIAFRGVADRVERRERGGQVTWQVLDYKTGKVEGKVALGEDWETKLRDGQHGKALQLLLYAAMLRATTQPRTAFAPRSVRGARTARQGQPVDPRWEGQSVLTEEHDLRLQGWLRQVVADLLPKRMTASSTRRGEPILCGLPGAGVDFRHGEWRRGRHARFPGQKSTARGLLLAPAGGPASNAGSNSPNTSGNAAGI